MDVSVNGNAVFAFAGFRLDPARRALFRDGVPIKLAGRLFDTLLYLVENADRLVEKDELFGAVWGRRIVEDNTLTQTISMLRKALQAAGAQGPVIVTVAGRGYRFAAPVTLGTGDYHDLPGNRAAPQALPLATGQVEDIRRPRPRRVAAYLALACLGLGLLGLRLLTRHAAPSPPVAAVFSPPPHSVAVLPFDTIGGDISQSYLAEGLSEEVIAALSQVGQLRVVARTSSFSVKGSQLSLAEIARRLNVGAVLEGSIRQDGKRLRITAALIDTTTGYAIWSRTFDRPVGDMLHLETDIAAEVTGALRVSLLGNDLERMRRGSTDNPDALDAYLRGIALKHRLDPASARLALSAFDRAVALDPNFALAHVLRARMLTGMAEGFGDASTDVDYLHLLAQQGLQEGELAVRLAPDLAQAHAALGAAAEDFWDFRRANSEFARAAELEPNDAATLIDYAWMQAYLGHTAASVAAAQRAASLNPLSQGVYVDLVWTLIWSHKPDQAQVALHHAEQLGVGKLLATYLKGRIALAQGDAAAAQRICAAGEDWKQNYCLAIADHLLGQTEAAEAQLAALRARMGDNAAFQYADIYAQWGRSDDALTALEKAYRLRDPGMMEIQVDPMLDPIRAMPRFQAVMHALDFPT